MTSQKIWGGCVDEHLGGSCATLVPYRLEYAGHAPSQPWRPQAASQGVRNQAGLVRGWSRALHHVE